MRYSNPLLDIEFLNNLMSYGEREIYARVTALDKNEKPIEYIEGKATGGSINVDGDSAVRRTCNLTMVAKEVNINDFYWGLKTKFKLEVGLRNFIEPQYPDIIWFKQGTYVITTFNTQQGTNNYTITINGKDKMCLLNGDLAGALPHTTDFGIEENYDSETGITTFRSIPIKEIIRESVQNFGNELAQNIIINDIEDAGLELLEYRGDRPLYFFRDVENGEVLNMTLNPNQKCQIENNEIAISDESIIYDSLVTLGKGQESPTVVTLGGEAQYTIIKVEYGQICGYRLTDLVFAGDLIGAIGETLTSILDKIKNMLGEFEYFYDLDGRFIFQKKKTYIDTPWNAVENNSDEDYIDASVNRDTPEFSFTSSNLITAIQNTPNLLNLRNDFAVWGKKKTSTGTELDIHMRYAIDKKPEKYHSLIDDKDYIADEWDWRELIYRMALDYRKFYHDDDFLVRVAEANPQYPNGKTGYEQYYTDLEGFWRILYNPDESAGVSYESIPHDDWVESDVIYVNAFKLAEEKPLIDNAYIYDKELKGFYPFAESNLCALSADETYYYKNVKNEWISYSGSDFTTTNLLLGLGIEQIYYADEEGVKINVLTSAYDNYNGDIYIIDKEYLILVEGNSIYENKPKSFTQYYINKLGEADKEQVIRTYKINYYKQTREFAPAGASNQYWSKVITEAPETLLFWFDFLDSEYSEIGQYSVEAVGSRTKAINDTNVKAIYYRDTPHVIFQVGEEIYDHQTGYTYIKLQSTMENLFTISTKGKSAKERIDELLYQHGYCTESISLTVLPIYHLQPNTRIQVRDENSKINGEYLVNKLTIPLTYNGTMSITAIKAVSQLNIM